LVETATWAGPISLLFGAMASAKYDKDLLWEELNLGSLVNSMQPVHGLADRMAMEEINKSRVLKKHNDIVQKPTYGALMDRYQALPHKPKTIQSKKLDILADPIRGRFSRIDKFLGNLEHGRGDEYPASSVSPSKRSMNSKGIPKSPRSPMGRTGNNAKQVSGFFLTGGDDNSAEPDNESQEIGGRGARRGGARGGLATKLRDRVAGARTNVNGRSARKVDPLAGKRNPATKGRIAAKSGWTDNTRVNYLGKNKGIVKKTGVISEDYKEKRDYSNRRGTNVKVQSSGYGNKKTTERLAPPASRAPLPPVCTLLLTSRAVLRLMHSVQNVGLGGSESSAG
jgi:hypothetical protein